MNKEMQGKLTAAKRKYIAEGFVILGIFGSYARGEETEGSDIDVLYEVTESFCGKYRGFDYFARIDEIRNELRKEFGCEVDFADIHGLNRIGRKYIIPEVVYV
jgi:hypothetical protein